MPNPFELDPKAICCAVHPALAHACAVCGAEAERPCVDDGEVLPVFAVHVGRETDGEPWLIQHTGKFTENGESIFHAAEKEA